jgi:hypothetical protein
MALPSTATDSANADCMPNEANDAAQNIARNFFFIKFS